MESVEFEAVISDNRITIVDFWAPWCLPCKAITPLLDELDAAYSELKLVKINVDEHREVLNAYGIMSIPTVLLFVDGLLVSTLMGAKPKQVYAELIESYLAEDDVCGE